ncbi:family 78 glycoside hydrolase catalytic domain [Paenibacillus sp. R14(2021)]|uniref:family 78 glycoside hydrolase catalytic domain n=1 Tax=Paenibacillus sp. R14(2021) TaxID=2859228 RepID=UPI001C613AE7|nr:family 78 glycoside hydrolase catalytic domain [Paenibacillus sp. R14(2021)]
MWQASWIWGEGKASPRNEWRCFRKTFHYEGAAPRSETKLRLTADSRYVLTVNGVQVGRGPIRSFPSELPYDEYVIGHLLNAGEDNTIAVLVMHYGLATFQYLRGRGGLLLQVDQYAEDGVEPETLVHSDASWTTALHGGYDATSQRISCQLAFTERYDSRSWSADWTVAGFDDSAWEQAAVIGKPGMAPWTSIVPRPIPYLTEEPIYPTRVEEMNYVKPVPWSAVFDVRTIMVPESVNHANPVTIIGLLAAVVTMKQDGVLTIGSVDNGRMPLRVSLGGRWCAEENYYGEAPQEFVQVRLAAGEHLMLLDLNRGMHGHAYHLGLDSDVPFEIRSPLDGQGQRVSEDVPFAAIGPFGWAEHIDHQPDQIIDRNPAEYQKVKGSVSEQQLMAEFGALVRPIDRQLYHTDDVYTQTAWRVVDQPQRVPSSLQRAVLASADAGVIPVHSELDTEIIIDLGRELTGYISFDLDAGEGTIIDAYGFEYMRDGWRQYTYELDNTLRYTAREGRQSYTSVVRRGLRYLAVTVRSASRPVKLYDIKLLQSNFPVANAGTFHSSNAMLNEIWRISRDTTRMCMEDTFVDCPAFEQTFWVGDARNASLINYYAFGSSEIVERILRLVPKSAFQTPLYGDQVPSGWSSAIPNWTFFWVTACLEHYHYTGNEAFARELWPHVRFTLEHYLQKIDERGLFKIKGWNLLDWANFEQPGDGVVSPQNMFLVKALRDAALLAAAAGYKEQQARFEATADRLREAINLHLWDEGRQAYRDCIHIDGRPSETTSMQTQVVASLCGIAEGKRAEVLEGYIVEPPASFVQIGSPFMSFFYHEALAKLNRQRVMTQDILTQYGAMVDNGATTVWEVYPTSGITHNPNMLTRSHCHAWSAGPVYFLGSEVLGVRGLTPGWTKVRIAPQPSGLAWARGSVPLPGSGRIDVSWRLDEAAKRMKLRVVSPVEVELDIAAPAGYELELEQIVVG